MRRALGLGLLLAALAATPAGAAAPAPTYIDFEDAAGSDPQLQGADFGAECGTRVNTGAAHSGTQFLTVNCSPLFVNLPSGQSTVRVFYRSPPGFPGQVVAIGNDASFDPVANASETVTPGQWDALVLSTPDGAATITQLEMTFEDDTQQTTTFDIDDFGFSPSPQPDVEITGGPGGGDPTFTFAGNQPGMTFTCRMDTGPLEPCASPKSYPGLAEGGHTFEVVGRDRWGVTDSASRRFSVTRPVADRDGDGVADPSDNCPDSANAGQGDADSDGVGDACELLPSGNAPIEAGKAAKVQLVSGEVFVKLPAGSAASAFTSGLRVPFQSSGFLPLKGVAAVPMGSTLDTRRGEVSITAAVNGQPPASRRQLRREARFRAGIFAIRQARRARRAKRSKRIPPRAELASPAGAEAPCRASGPPKGVAVRSLSMTAKGVFRAVGGAATATPAKGTSTFITTDRCDGTVTEVGRGSVAVIARRTGKRRVVRAGRAYIVRARLFAARKGRRP